MNNKKIRSLVSWLMNNFCALKTLIKFSMCTHYGSYNINFLLLIEIRYQKILTWNKWPPSVCNLKCIKQFQSRSMCTIVGSAVHSLFSWIYVPKSRFIQNFLKLLNICLIYHLHDILRKLPKTFYWRKLNFRI